MLAPALGHHFSDGLTVAKKRAVGELLLSSTGNQLLHHDLARTRQLRCLLKQSPQLGMAVGAPRFCLGDVKKVLLDCRLDGEGWRDIIQLRQLIDGIEVIGPRDGNVQFLGQAVGIALVPGALHALPCRRWYTEYFAEFGPVVGEGSNQLFPRGIQNPSLESESLSKFEQAIHGTTLVV